MLFFSRFRVLAVMAAAATLSACAGANGTLPPSPQGFGAGAFALPDAAPPACKGQTKTKQSATVIDTLSTKGGLACIPAFGGFGGSVRYPGANPSVDLTLTSSTTNYAKLPSFGSGTPLFYLQLALSGSTTFAAGLKAGGGLTGKKIVAKETYTAFGAVLAFGIYVPLTPCYVVAKPGKYGGVIGGIGTLLKGQSVPKTSGVIEIYGGKQASDKC